MKWNLNIWALFLIFASIGMCPQVFSASSSSDTRVLRAVNAAEPPFLDGILDEAVWEGVPRAEPFKQKEPTEGRDASEPTYVKVIYTENSLFFGIVCLDSSPAEIVATELRRDGDLKKDDSVWILIDSLHDHRNAFLFATNAQGTQYDALIIDEGKETNKDWDEAWRVASHRNEEGWSVEFEIPFKVLRLRDSDREIGLEFQRVIRRKNEFVFWNSWERDFRFEEVSRAGHLAGLESIELAKRWRLKGYVVGGAGERGQGGWENRSDAGIDDIKWRVTPTLTADLTFNTDFGEVEVDAQQANFIKPRSQLFFPEKREFFLEGAGFFDFSARMNEGIFAPTFRAFFSRRIGLSQDGQRVPIVGGVKITGRTGAFSIGALNMQTQEEGGIEGSNYSVVRIRHDLFSRSSIGAIITNQSGEGSFNRTAGVDSRFLLFDNLTLDSFFIRSAEPGVNEDQNAYHARAYWQTDLWEIGVGHLTLQPNFNPEMGFVERSDNRKTIGDITFKPRPDISWLRQIELRAFYEYFTNQENVVAQKVGHYALRFILESGGEFRIAMHTRFNRLFRPLGLAPGVEILPGDYIGRNWSFTYTGDPARPLAGMIRYGFQDDYFGGKRSYLRINSQWKPTPSLILDLGYDLEHIRLPQKDFYSHIINLGINYSFNTRLITTTILQYNNLEQIKGVNFRLNYIYRPGDDLFLVYRDIRNQLRPEFSDRAVLVKFTRSFDF
ncbi:carbohydrate binding family 9 domain-containing protein [Acidobacteria bacterium AH-259-D05]|nr:carbohydrate binding family 9 domain-containing protein [Acidobacteria bacterium AH-259-D05]